MKNIALENITINAQSSIKIKGSKILYFDAFKVEEENKDADYIFITHDHFDHFDISSINKIKNNQSIIIAPKSIEDVVLKEIKDNKCIFLKLYDELKEDDLMITAIPSYNVGKPFHPEEKRYIGYTVKMDDVVYFIAGDTDENKDNLKVKCDVALIPVGGKYTMNPDEAANFINKIKPMYAIPTHYGKEVGNFEDGETFKKLVDSSIKIELKL